MMITNSIKPVFIIALSAVLLYACNTGEYNPAGKNNSQQKDSTAGFKVFTFPTQKGFGYSIFVNNKEFIRQDCIPVIQGNKPFLTEPQAAGAGKLVAEKLRQHQVPSLTLQELDSLGVIQ